MTSSTLERLLAAANASDIDRLHQLTALCALVGPLCQLVHTLQRERGASSIVLGSRGQRFITRYQTHVADSQTAEAALHAALEHWMTAPGEAAHEVHARDPRLLRRLADAVNEAEALARLRARVEQQQVTADEATRLYNRTIGTLLSVVFEVADTASDADITRVLVSLFHFIQGKELAGQERACGALGFTLGHFDEPHRHTLQTLIDTQNDCFETFTEFADETLQTRWAALMEHPALTTLNHLRSLALTDAALPDELTAPGEQWYALATQRIDAMKALEDQLVEALHQSCREALERAHQRNIDSVTTGAEPMSPSAGTHTTPSAEQAMARHFDRSLLELVQAQNSRLQQLSDELADTRKTLRERKLIERAKGLLMAQQHIDEDSAYRLMRKTAMDQSQPLVAVARAMIELADR
ncbi:nitrate regulatory protein [Kushneria phosphatilytica]|uniref:nitrate regulatory protein n=1 Tax=Kushneria phosphatilytica TaxID=657387 RepID=UPI00143DBF58|nr:nitrate regulatory protein [Kushneria phosphatilytica]